MPNNDIYQIVGRIKNLIAVEDIALSPAGNVLVNTYALALADLYRFSDTLSQEQGDSLRKILSQKEDLPRYVIKLVNPEPEEPDHLPDEPMEE
jgi:hypothetical protein